MNSLTPTVQYTKINEILKDEFKNGLHALEIKVL